MPGCVGCFVTVGCAVLAGWSDRTAQLGYAGSERPCRIVGCGVTHDVCSVVLGGGIGCYCTVAQKVGFVGFR